MTRTRIRTHSLSCCGLPRLIVILLLTSGVSAKTRPETIVLEGARLIDGTGRPPIENSVLVILEGKVRNVGAMGTVRYRKGARVVDVHGKTIIPALINLHGHLGLTKNGLEAVSESYNEQNVRAQLDKYLAYGVGAVLSLGSDQDLVFKLRDDQRAGHLPGALIFTAGRGFGRVGGYPPGISHPRDVFRPGTPERARDEVQELASENPDFVKIWVDDDFGRLPKIKPEIYRAIIDEANRQNLRVIAHVFYLADAKDLIEAGVDGLGHSIRDQPVDSPLINSMKARGIFLIPTLVRDESTFAYAQSATWLDDPFFQAGLEAEVLNTLRGAEFVEKFRTNPNLSKLEAAFEMAKKNLKSLSDAGIKIGFGTDSGPPLRFQGYFEHRELQLMVESGLTPMQAIVAATRTNAEILSPAVRFGTLLPGRRADFLVLDANPLEDIRNTEKLSAVWQAGKPMRAINAR